MNSAMKQNRAKTTMRRISQATVLALLIVSQPQAQPRDESIASLRDVHGNVLVSNEAGLSSGDEGLRLVAGTRVITTAKSDVIVAYDNGCNVKLEENQRFEVDKGRPCALLLAQPYTILLTPAIAASSSVVAVVAQAVAGIASVAALIDSRTKTTASPS